MPAPDADEDPFGAVSVEPAEEGSESPFGVTVIDPGTEAAENPFATTAEAHDTVAERFEIEEMLASARAVTAALEDALARSREHERVLVERLSRL